MPSVRETYDLPKRPPLPFKQFALMASFPLAALVLWLLLPDSPVAVALLAISLLVAVFIGVGMILRTRGMDKEPGRDPVTPPSIEKD